MEKNEIKFKPGSRILKITNSAERKIIESIEVLKIIEETEDKIRLENGVLLRKGCLEAYHMKNIKPNIDYYYLNSFVI